MTDGKTEALESQREQQNMAVKPEKKKPKTIAFDPAAWLSDLGVASLSFYEQGVWMRLICLMHASSRPGRLWIGERMMSDREIARAVGLDLQELNAVIRGLLAANVCSQDDDGIYCRRMVREAEGGKRASDTSSKDGKALMQYPVVGGAPGGVWVLYEGQVKAWAEAYPNLNVEESCKQALTWVLADQKRRKTAGGMTRFLVAWMAKQTDSGRRPVQGKAEKGGIERLDLE